MLHGLRTGRDRSSGSPGGCRAPSFLRASRDGEVATQRVVDAYFAQFEWDPRAILRRPTTVESRGEFAHPGEIDDRERLTIVAEYPTSNVKQRESRLLLRA